MAVKFESVKAGDILWDCHRYKAGPFSRMGSWSVRVISIDHAAGVAVVSWNSNAPQTYRRRQVERLRRTKVKERVM